MSGGDDGIRTHDLSVANAALSQLSYIPTGNGILNKENNNGQFKICASPSQLTIECDMHQHALEKRPGP